MCYRDKTFCKSWKECQDGKGCISALAPKVIRDAKKWWDGKNPPISIIEKFECFKQLKKEKKK